MAVYGPARLGVMRLNAFRLGYYQPWIKVVIGGTTRTTLAMLENATITHLLNHEPDTCSLRVWGFTPTRGQEIKIYCGDTDLTHQLFGGRILNVETTYIHKANGSRQAVYDLSGIDYTWLLNRRKVIKKYTNQSASTIAADLISTYTSGFTTTAVVSGLATIDEITFTNEDVTDALSRLAERIGGYWYIDYASDLHFFLTESTTAASITDSADRGTSGLRQSVDLSQVATRVTTRAGGSNASADVAVGGTTIPVDDIAWYSGSGGTVEIGQQRITYTGTAGTTGTGSNTGYIAPPPSTLTLTAPVGAGSLDPSASYTYAVTYKTAAGETTQSGTVTGNSGASGQAQLETIPVPTDPLVTDVGVYRTDGGGGGGLRLVGYITPGDTFLTDTLGDGSLGAAIPTENTAGPASEATPSGSTTLQVEDLSQFASAGWAAGPGGQLFRYTGRSASTGSGTLTGIPSSGAGSLTAPLRAGTIKSVPHLTGCSGVVYAINTGDPVNVVVTVNDTTAQTNMASYVGGDGIHEAFISDGRWSLTEATAQANAYLTLNKDPITTVMYETRDQTQNVGSAVTFSVTTPAVSGTHKIQSVTLTELGLSGPRGALFPKRAVTASSRRFSLPDILRQIKST